jgi:uncharacterized protein YejL (UPF0352 family)
MSKLARIAATAGVTAALMGGVFAPAASAGSSREYTCTNQGGGRDHQVTCIGQITTGDVLTGTTINIGDVNVLSDNQLKDLQAALVNVADTKINAPVNLQLIALENAVIKTYLTKFGVTVLPVKVKVCAPLKGVCI